MKNTANIVAIVTSAIVGFFLVGDPICNAQSKEFTSQAGSFSVMAPAPLTEEVRSSDLPQVGKISIHIFTATKGNKAYVVSYVDFPEQLQVDPEQRLDASSQGAAANLNGKLVVQSKISLGGNPGREIVVDANRNGRDATLKARIYVVHNRLYQVMVVAPKGEVSNDEIMKYLESFKLI
jgi:hypothetical protein